MARLPAGAVPLSMAMHDPVLHRIIEYPAEKKSRQEEGPAAYLPRRRSRSRASSRTVWRTSLAFTTPARMFPLRVMPTGPLLGSRTMSPEASTLSGVWRTASR